MKVDGRMICSMDSVFKNGLIKANMKVNIKLGKDMV